MVTLVTRTDFLVQLLRSFISVVKQMNWKEALGLSWITTLWLAVFSVRARERAASKYERRGQKGITPRHMPQSPQRFTAPQRARSNRKKKACTKPKKARASLKTKYNEYCVLKPGCSGVSGVPVFLDLVLAPKKASSASYLGHFNSKVRSLLGHIRTIKFGNKCVEHHRG